LLAKAQKQVVTRWCHGKGNGSVIESKFWAFHHHEMVNLGKLFKYVPVSKHYNMVLAEGR